MAIQEALDVADVNFEVPLENPNNKWWHERISDVYIPRDPYYLGNGAEHHEAVMPLFLELATRIERSADDFRHLSPPGEGNNPCLVLSPVFAGSLPKEATAALLSGTSPEGLQRVLKDTLPEPEEDEDKWVLSQRRAKQLTQQTGQHINFDRIINIVFVEDEDDSIVQLYEQERERNHTSSYEALLALHRHEIAKTGAYKTVLVPYQIKNGRAEATIAAVGTLEGGHPKVGFYDTQGLTERLLKLGATRDVGLLKPDKEEPAPEVSSQQWQTSDVVQAVIKFFSYSDREKLIDPPVVLNRLIKNQEQANIIGRVVNWHQQQESAGLAYDPNLGLWVVTGSGRQGIDKRRLQPTDLTPVWTKGGKLVPGRVSGLDTPRPSVEAQEVLKAQMALQELSPIYLTEGGGFASPIRTTLHLHRGEDTLNRMVKTRTEHTVIKDGVMWLAPGKDDYDHIGCGMEEMDARTEDAMLHAYGEWEASNRRADFVLWYVANHGMMAAEFVDKGSAPFEKIKHAINEGHISITRSVLQV